MDEADAALSSSSLVLSSVVAKLKKSLMGIIEELYVFFITVFESSWLGFWIKIKDIDIIKDMYDVIVDELTRAIQVEIHWWIYW